MTGRILWIEDEQRIAEFLVRGLTEEGYAVEHVADGLLFLDRAQKEATIPMRKRCC